jgi:2-octaprenyl-6-methoxyphenol hydroxylase
MVAAATDVLTRLFGLRGRLPAHGPPLRHGRRAAPAPLKRWFMDEARGMSGKLPDLLKA